MERATVGFLMLIGFLMLLPANFSFAQQTTMCISQFALANQACSVLPSEQALGSRNHTRSQADGSDSGSSDDGDEDDDEDDSSNDIDGEDNDDVDDEGEDEREHRRKRGRRKKKEKGRKQGKHGRKRGNGHKHKRGGDDDEPRANKDCCRWLEELDERCVCGALLHLPPFLVKTYHKYSIMVGNSCKFSYNCRGI